MRIIILSILLFIISISNGQVSQRCPICPPSQGDAPNGSCLQVNNGVAEWASCGGGGGFWSLTGNSGTTAGTNFIGTTDSKELYFKTKNITAIVVDTNQNVGIGVTPAEKLTVMGSFRNVFSNGPYLSAIGNVDFSTFGFDSALFVAGNPLSPTAAQLQLWQKKNYLYAHADTIRLKGNVAIENGTQGAGKVLTSDASGNATWSNQILTGSATLDFGTIAPNSHETLTITVTGAALGDVVSLGIPNASTNDHGAFMAWVSATNTVSVKCFNFDGVGFDPASGTFTAKIFK